MIEANVSAVAQRFDTLSARAAQARDFLHTYLKVASFTELTAQQKLDALAQLNALDDAVDLAVTAKTDGINATEPI